MDNLETPSLTSRPLRLQLIDGLANFAKSLAIYPPTNNRVIANLDTVITAYKTIQAQGKPRPIRVLFGAEHLRIDGEEHEIGHGTQVAWLRDRLDRTSLVGFEMSHPLRRESVVTFSRLLLDNYARTDGSQDFEALWKNAPDDMLPIERRFDGGFSDSMSDLDLDGEGGEVNYLAHALASEESIQGRLLALQMVLDHDIAGPKLSIDLLDHISRLLPADVMTDLSRVVEMTNRMIEAVTEKMEAPPDEDSPEDRQLERMLSTVAQNLFARNDARLEVEPKEEEAAPKAPSAKGHKGDDAIHDDVDEMLREFDQLPNFDPQIALFRAEDTYAEQIGVFLHYLLQDEDRANNEVLQQHVMDLLESRTPSVFEVLNEYVDLLASPQGRQSIHTERLVEILRDSGLSHLLRDRSVVTADSVRESFPDDFGLYLDALDMTLPGNVVELVAVCEDLGDELIVSNGQRLVRDQRLLHHGRMEKVLRTAAPGFEAIATVIVMHGDESHRILAVDYLRSLELDRKEACLLAIGEGVEYFPREYLVALLDPTLVGDRRKEDKLRQWVAMILRRYIRFEENPEDRRIYAIRMLVDFWEDEATELLQGLLKQPLIGRSTVPPGIRKAAKETLITMGAD